MHQKISVKTIVSVGIGSAVFVILGRFAAIPIGIPNTNLEIVYPFLALVSAIFGPLAGGLVGLIGHLLKDATYGTIWFSWVACSGILGVVYGWMGKRLRITDGLFRFKEKIYFNICQVLANALIWGLLAPTLDIFIYSEAPKKIYLQSIAAVVSNSLSVGIVGTLLLSAYAATRTKKGSLSKASEQPNQ